MEKFEGKDITVLMSVYKQTKVAELVQAVDSVYLNQSVQPKQIMIVVDGPVDGELEDYLSNIEDDSMFNIVRLAENKGLSVALNEGMKKIDTKLVARMDSDDIAVSDRFEVQLADFNAIEQLIISGGTVTEFTKETSDAGQVRKMPEEDAEIRKFAKYRSPFNHPTVMFLKSAIDAVGGYQPMGKFEDYYLWTRLINDGHGYLHNTDKVLVHMRAGDDLYARRGSGGYFEDAKKLRKWMLDHRLINYMEFGIGITLNFLSNAIPVKARRKIYQTILRDKIEG